MLSNVALTETFREVSWKISNACNMNCPYCVRTIKKDDEKPPIDEIIPKINDLFYQVNGSDTCLYITGGEPYIWNIEDIVSQINAKNIRITSNMSFPSERYLKTREIIESQGKKFLLKGSFHLEEASFDKQIEFMHKLAECKVDFINVTVNDDNYPFYMELFSNFDFDGDKIITIDNHTFKVNWMVERLTGGGVASNVKTVPKKSRTFAINGSCQCSAGYTSIRIEPNGNVKRCACSPVEYNILNESPHWLSDKYKCNRATCPGCFNIWVYDRENIKFFHKKD